MMLTSLRLAHPTRLMIPTDRTVIRQPYEVISHVPNLVTVRFELDISLIGSPTSELYHGHP